MTDPTAIPKPGPGAQPPPDAVAAEASAAVEPTESTGDAEATVPGPLAKAAEGGIPAPVEIYGHEMTPAEKPQAGWLAENLSPPIAGFGVSFATIFRKVYTEEYPEVKRPTAPRYHGRHQLNRHPDGLEKCVGCELCAWACPADAILVEGADNDDTPVADGGTGRFSPGERYGRVYEINYLRCIFCGLCIEACPTRALTMTNFYELADTNRADLIFTKDQLLAPLQEGMLAAPHPMAAGLEERDYYIGKVDAATDEQRAWVREHSQDALAELAGAEPADEGGATR